MDEQKASNGSAHPVDPAPAAEAPVEEVQATNADEPTPADTAAEGEATAEAEPEAPTEPTLEEKLAEAESSTAAMREKMLRVAADFDNYRKRANRDADEANKRGKKSVVMELLPVFDNLERALSHGDDAADAKSMVDGLRMVHKQFLGALSKLGMTRVEALGEVFDPNLHDSIQHLNSDEYDAGRVMAVLQPGYRMGETLVRPAMVVVSKGPMQPEPAEDAAAADGAQDAAESDAAQTDEAQSGDAEAQDAATETAAGDVAAANTSQTRDTATPAAATDTPEQAAAEAPQQAADDGGTEAAD